MASRASAFDDFAAEPPKNRAAKGDVATLSSFPSREVPPDRQPTADSVQPVYRRPEQRAPRLFRTGRNATITLRASPEMVERFYAVADRLDLKVADVFERAVELLEASSG